jgi:polyisoprenoid-binding protein YceI
MDAQIHVYTFKEGFLSKLAHDLALSVTRFDIEVDAAGHVRARLDTRSLEVQGVMDKGALDRAVLSVGDREKIQQTMREEVLLTAQHSEALFEGQVRELSEGVQLNGSLRLRGREHPLQLELQRRGVRLRGELELVPSRFGIKPYRALGGALKVQDRVRIAIDAEAPPPGLAEEAGTPRRWSSPIAGAARRAT